MDEEELQKRFTDCVYFLASPLTCKKGIECEYRHNEIARLNPRDCWYWLGGCCFNPDCAFRHPPLEGLNEAYHESSNLSNAPVDKTNIPCYFYSKGFCYKGENCSFLHGPADVSIALKPSKPVSIVNNPVPSEVKLSAESNTGSPPVKSLSNPSDTAEITHTNTVGMGTQDSHQERSESPDVSPDVSNSSILPEEYVQSESDVFNDQSSGFDVIVEGESERVVYEQDVDFFDVHDEEDVDYFPELRKEKYDVYDSLDNGQSRKSIFYRLSFKKRNLESEPIFNGRKGRDIGEYLKRRKVFHDGCFSKGYDRNFRRYPQRKAVPVNRFRKPQFMQEKRRFQEKSAIFKGPKTLDEIREEKKNALQKKDGFQSPRPLSEILKNKRKLG